MKIRFFLSFLAVTIMACYPVLAQVGSHVHDLPAATTPFPTGSCFYVDQLGTDRSQCSHWAEAIGAQSSTLDTQSNESPFAIPVTDAFKIVLRTNRNPQADTIAAPTVNGYGSGFGFVYFSSPQGNSVNPPLGLLINGRAGLTFGAHQGARIFSDGINYHADMYLPTASSQDGTQVLSNDNQYKQVGSAQLAPGAVTTPALASGLNLTSPSITLGSDAPGDLYMRGANGQLVRLPPGAANTVLAITAGVCTINSNGVTTCTANMPGYQTTLSPTVLPIATNTSNGVGRPDGSSLTADPGGTWHAAIGIDSVADNVTALGTGQSDCKQLTTKVTYLTAGANDSGVCLIGAVKGSEAHVCNITGNEYFVYPMADGSSINDNPGTTPVIVGRGCVGFLARSANAWWTTGPRTPLLVK